MINELYELSKELSQKGIRLQQWHREYKPIPKATSKSPCIRLWITPEGCVRDFETLPIELANHLRRYGNNQGNFPAFNMVSLYRVVDKEEVDQLKTAKEQGAITVQQVKNLCHSSNWVTKKMANMRQNLVEKPLQLRSLIGEANENIILELINALTYDKEATVKRFRQSLEACALKKIEKGFDISLALSLLLYAGSEDKSPDDDVGPNLSIIMDYTEWNQFGHPIASQKSTEELNQLLLNSIPDESISSILTDAFGTPFENPNEPMPSIKLPGFDATLRSMFSGQPCQMRYGTIEDKSYPIARQNRTHLQQAIEWLADESRKGITWLKINKDQVLFVYPTKLPNIPIRYASLFGEASNTLDGKTLFETAAKNFLKTMQGIPTAECPETVKVFSLRKMDKARTKVVYSHNASSKRIAACAQRWANAVNNLPKTQIIQPFTPYPLDVPLIVNRIWKQDGNQVKAVTDVDKMKSYQGIELFLETTPLSFVQNYLHTLLQNTSALIRVMGGRLHRKENIPFKSKELSSLSDSIACIGIMLSKGNQRKEEYMEKLPYLLGQLLHVSDELHLYYCKDKRNGDVPPQLVGNSLFATASEMPFQAIAQLASRVNPYLAWAKQYRYKKQEFSSLVSWYLYQYEKIADALIPVMNKEARFSDFEKASLFIGYLASLPKTEKKTEGEETDE